MFVLIILNFINQLSEYKKLFIKNNKYSPGKIKIATHSKTTYLRPLCYGLNKNPYIKE